MIRRIVLLSLGSLYMMYSAGCEVQTRFESAPAHSDDIDYIRVSDVSLASYSSGPYRDINGVVHNQLDRRVNVAVQCTVYDAEGRIVETARKIVEGVPPGGSMPFQYPMRVEGATVSRAEAVPATVY